MIEIPETLRQAEEINRDIPTKSKERYNEEFDKFLEWLDKEKNGDPLDVSDDVLLGYLVNLSKSVKPSTLWSKFSMIKTCLKLKNNVDTLGFYKCSAFLKRQSVDYVPKKSNVLTADEVAKFMIEASDKEWLLAKVVLVFGVFGACRRDELSNLNVEDIKDNGSYITVFLKQTDRSQSKRIFTIADEDCPFKPCQFIRKYLSLRPSKMTSKRLFIGYRHGKCVAQHVGKNTFAGVPKKVAQYLGLENPEDYTVHALRRTSASIFVGGGDFWSLKRHRMWKSSLVSEYNSEESSERNDVSNKLLKNVNTPSSSRPTLESEMVSVNQQSVKTEVNEESDPLNFFTADGDTFEDSSNHSIITETISDNVNENINVHLTSETRLIDSAKGFLFSNNYNCTFNFYVNGEKQ